MVYQVSADYAHDHFEQIIQQAKKETGGVVITQGDRKFVLIEQSKIRDLQEAEEEAQLSNLFREVQPLKTELRTESSMSMEDLFS